MIDVGLFAGLCQGRQRVSRMEPENLNSVNDMMDCLTIPPRDGNILLVSAFRQMSAFPFKDRDMRSLFPAVGGG